MPPSAVHQVEMVDWAPLILYQVKWALLWNSLGRFRLMCWLCVLLATFFVCVRTMFTVTCCAAHVISSGWELYIGFQLDVARAIVSRTGWLDVLTARAARCIPNNGQVRNSPAGVCSMFIRRFRICSTEKRIGTLPLSRMSTQVVVQPVCAWSCRKWITSLSLTVDCSPFANENLLEHGCFENQMWSRFGCCCQAWDDLSQSGNPWLWYNPSQESHKSMRTKIHIRTQERLLSTMIIIQICTLFRSIGVEWADVLLIRMHVTKIGRDALVFNKSDALCWVPFQTLEALVQQGHEQKHVIKSWSAWVRVRHIGTSK